VAKTRYGWEKRAKELARQAKQAEKMKRRQNKSRFDSDAKPSDERDDQGEPPSPGPAFLNKITN